MSVQLSSLVTRYSEFRLAVSAGCDRLVGPSIADRVERQRASRTVGVLLAAPFIAAVGAFLVLPASLGLATTLALICGAFGVAWLLALILANGGGAALVHAAGLAVASVCVAGLVAAAGGLSSPAALIVLALPIEAWLVGRSRKALGWGAAASVVAVAMQGWLGHTLQINAVIAASHWLVPLAYGATLLARFDSGSSAVTEPRSSAFPSVEQVVDAVVLRFAGNGDVVDADGAARHRLGLDPVLLLGTGFFDRIHIADRVGFLCTMADLRQGAARGRAELRLRLPRLGEASPADNYRPFAIEFARAGDGEDGFVGLLSDDSRMADMRVALKAAKDENERLDNAKGRFLAAVSHELRTPLNSIIGFSDMLLHEMFGGFADPRQKEYVGIVRDSGHHLLEVVNSILDVSKMEAGAYTTNPELFLFRDAVDMCSTMMSLQADAKSIRLTTSVAPEIGEICADRRAVQQILINLVSNAVKFTPNGGRVSVGAKRLGGRVHLAVADTGIGIAEEDLARLGRPFAQVQNDYTRQFEGAGLGLSLVKGLVALHEGTMSIESALGGGTTVTITLPIDGPAMPSREPGGELLTMNPARAKERLNGTLRKAG